MQSHRRIGIFRFSNYVEFTHRHLLYVHGLLDIRFFIVFYFMTAFNEVLIAEQEAEQSIEAATKEAAAAVTKAKTDRDTVLATTEQTLQEEAIAATAATQTALDAKVQKIKAVAAAEVTVIQQQFSAQQTELKTLLTQRFQ